MAIELSSFKLPVGLRIHYSVSFGSWLYSRLVSNNGVDLGWHVVISSSIRSVSALSKRAGLLGLSSANGVLARGLASICT